ncbi:MAG: polyhydroxyalkanoate synthesis regulator DNA-binding domain-containing protein [Thermodesulfobacteriota bacterium]
MPEKIILKKYANRRLYDTERSAYITFNQVADMIRQGHQVEVIDDQTKENVTSSILIQIILEEARKKNELLSMPLLHLIIQYGDNILSEFFDKYLQQTIKNYLAYKSAFDEQFRKWLDLGMDFSDIGQKLIRGIIPAPSFFNRSSDSTDHQKKNRQEE